MKGHLMQCHCSNIKHFFLLFSAIGCNIIWIFFVCYVKMSFKLSSFLQVEKSSHEEIFMKYLEICKSQQ